MAVMLTPDSRYAIMIVADDIHTGYGGGYIALTESGEDVCQCCPDAGGCKALTEWRIRDLNGNVDELSGEIVTMAVVNVAYQKMMLIPQPWTLRHYNNALPFSLSMVLEVKCDGSWKKVDEWTSNVATCAAGGRYPTHTIAIPVYDPPAPCDCARTPSNPNECANPFVPCPKIMAGTEYEPPNHQAVKFTGAVDGEWTNLKNWKDTLEASPARELPDSESNIIIDALLSTVPGVLTLIYGGQTLPTVNGVVINAGAEIRIRIATRHAEVRGTVGKGDGTCYDGVLEMIGMLFAAKFYDDGLLTFGATVEGNAEFYDTSKFKGLVVGNAELYNSSEMKNTAVDRVVCQGTVAAFNNALIENADFFGELTMWDYSHMAGDNVAHANSHFHDYSYIESGSLDTGNNDCTFDGHSQNAGTLKGDAYFQAPHFSGDSFNALAGIIKGPALFSGYAINYGHVEGIATFTENARNKGTCEVDAVFSGGAINDIDGIVKGDGTFSSGYNWGMVEGDAAFSAGGGNGTGGPGSGSPITGTVKGDATFEGSANIGIVEGDATFSAGGNNLTYGTVEGNATFNASDNKGTVEGTATFNVTGLNEGHVTGLATFNGATHNGGFADGDAIFNGTAENMGAGQVAGTATFNVDSNNYSIPAWTPTVVCNTTGVCVTTP